jgi:hypothetical protein
MSSLGQLGRQSYKRRARQSKRGVYFTIDLNSPAPGADIINVASSSGSLLHAQSNPSPIYVDDADDDVQLLSASRFVPSQVCPLRSSFTCFSFLSFVCGWVILFVWEGELSCAVCFGDR